MSLFDQLTQFSGSAAGIILPFLIVLTIVVFFHELGHFLVARWCGVKVLTFSVGFGPELFGFNDRHGTRWRFAAVPLGGYVRFLGDDNAASMPRAGAERPHPPGRDESFACAPVSRRSAIVAAGPIANFILAVVIFAAVFMTFGRALTDARIDSVEPGSPAAVAGLAPGDVILAIDGRAIESFSEMQRIVSGASGRALPITVDRGGETVELVATPERREIDDGFGNKLGIGVLGIRRDMGEGDVVRERAVPVEAVGLGVQETWFVATRTLDYVAGIFVGRESADQLSGPIRIAQVSGRAAELGVIPLLQLTAVLSVSIGLLNLFPIPLLDGGHLVFYAYEALRGRPMSERAQEVGLRIGLAIVLMLMIVATWNDIRALTAL